MRFLTILLLPLFLAGCYTQVSVKEMLADTKHYQVPILASSDKGLIYVVRPNSFYGIFKYDVYVDGTETTAQVGYNRGYQYIYFYVEPGKHIIASKAENWSRVTVDVKAGETHYLIQNPGIGFLFGRNYLEKLNPVEGKYYIKHTYIGTIKPVAQ